MNDSEIVRQILQGDKDLYRKLVESYQPMIFRTCLGFLHNKDDADDLSQEVFIQAFQALKTFKGNSSFSTWIYRIAVNAALNKVRKTQKSLVIQRFASLFGTSKNPDINLSHSLDENPEELLITAEHKKWVEAALNALPENQRTAIVLSKYDDLSQKEISEIMNLSEGAVEALIQRAKANLRDKLSSSRKKNK
jgi:RNA polymerase sigma-70 factor, ECF subfamily